MDHESTSHPAPNPGLAARAELKRRGMTRGDLSAITGLSPDSITNICCGGGHHPSHRGQRLIEAALQMPFWTAPEVFAARLPMIAHFGVDIEMLDSRELQGLWRKVTGRRQVKRNRALLLSLLQMHFAESAAQSTANPS